MEFTDILKIILMVVSGMATAVPLIIKLVQYIQKATREKNWGKLLQIVMELMADAECMFDKGTDRKAWVMAGIKRVSNLIDYDIDDADLSDLIDDLCVLTKEVNPPEAEVDVIE